MRGLKRARPVDHHDGAKVAVLILGLLCYHGGANAVSVAEKGEKVEYIRLPLLTFEREGGGDSGIVSKPVPGLPFVVTTVGQRRSAGDGTVLLNPEISNNSSINDVLRQLTGASDEEEEDEAEFENTTKIDLGGEGNLEDDDDDINNEAEGEARDEDTEFSELDLIELVQELEQQADMEEQTGIFPEILDILHGKQPNKQSSVTSTMSSLFSTSTLKTFPEPEGFSNVTFSTQQSGMHARSNATLRISLNENGDLQLGSEDLSQFSEEIVDGISEGIEESLRMSDDLEIDDDTLPVSNDNATAETRQFSVYLFQGQYYAEPRLNRFIDGALRNMGTELRVASMDPLYFRVLPRGHVAEREQPLIASGGGGGGIRRRRPGGGGGGGLPVGRHAIVKRQLPAFFKLQPKKLNKQQQVLRLQQGRRGNRQQIRRKKNKLPAGVTKITSIGGTNIFLRRRRQQQRLEQQKKRRQQLRQQRLKQQLKNRLKKQQQNKNKNNQNNQKKNQILLNRFRRRIRQDVGGGRIEGFSRVQRDGDAEMQLFGNYTLIRSHMKMGPVEITMQFRTKNGIRRSGATLPVIRAHTVTRVNHEGSEMIDYLLDRPHPESIHVRGTLFPLAQKVARNIFARLFLPNSFLVSRLREKASLAFLSRPAGSRKR